MNNVYEFHGWIRRSPGKRWRLVCQAVNQEWAWKLLHDHRAPRRASLVVLPEGVLPYSLEKRRTHGP